MVRRALRAQWGDEDLRAYDAVKAKFFQAQAYAVGEDEATWQDEDNYADEAHVQEDQGRDDEAQYDEDGEDAQAMKALQEETEEATVAMQNARRTFLDARARANSH